MLARFAKPSLGRQLAAMSTAARPKPIQNPDIKHTGVSYFAFKMIFIEFENDPIFIRFPTS